MQLCFWRSNFYDLYACFFPFGELSFPGEIFFFIAKSRSRHIGTIPKSID